jgi:hypothetical protein
VLPNCFIIGAAKCGTTSLHDYLGLHPEIYMSPVKEPRYFTNAWSEDRAWYEALFDDAGDARWRGEATPNYSKATEFPETAARIAALVPEARLIYLVRDPVERVRSQYDQDTTPPKSGIRPLERRPFPIAIREDHRYVDGSRYAFQLDQYLAHFDRDQLLVVSSEQLRDNRSAALETVFTFLDVDPDFRDDRFERELHRSHDRRIDSPLGERIVRSVRGSGPSRVVPARVRGWLKAQLRRPRPHPIATVSPADEEWLWEQLGPDVERLRAHVGPDFHLWGRA